MSSLSLSWFRIQMSASKTFGVAAPGSTIIVYLWLKIVIEENGNYDFNVV